MTEFNNAKLKVLFTDDLQVPSNIVSGENISTSFAKIHNMFNAMIEVTGAQNENLQYLMDYGCKNLIRISNGITTETKRGITATYNQTEGTITLNGSHDGTGDAIFYLYSGNYADQPTIYPGTYYLDGVPSGGSPDTYVLILNSLGAFDTGDGKEFTLSSEGHIAPYIRIRKPSGVDVTFNNTVFRPMLCSKSIYNLSSSFQPCPGYIIYSNDLQQMKFDIDTNIDDIDSIKNVCSDLVDNKSKNKLLIQRNGLLERNGVTASFDPISGTVTLNGSNGGTATIFEIYTGNAVDQEVLSPGTYHMSGCASGGSTSSYRCALIDVTGAVDTGSGCTFTLTSSHYIAYRILISGNQTFNNTVFRPMVCKQEAWELSDTFFPYCPSWNSVNADGIKNLVDGINKNIFTTNTSTSTITDVTYTNNGDGTWTVNGTAAARRQKSLAFTVPSTLQSGRYILSGCPSGAVSGSTILYCLYLWDITANVRVSQNDTGDGTEFDWTPDSTHQYQIVIDIRSGTTASDLIFKPMICNQTYWTLSNTYVPYAPSNRELYLTKQDTLTDTQMEAVNSKIKESLVTSYVNSHTKNLLRLLRAPSETKKGITATYNLLEGTITLNGTHDGTGDANFYLYIGAAANCDPILPGKYHLSGVPSGGSTTTYRLVLSGLSTYDVGNGADFTVTTAGTIAPYIRISKPSGQTVSFDNVVFRPMVCTQDDWNVSQEFQPYKWSLEQIYKVLNGQLSGYNISFYGDSITTYSGWLPTGNKAFYTGSNCGVSSVDQTWWMRTINATGASLLVDQAWSGRCVSNIRDSETDLVNSGAWRQTEVDKLSKNGVSPDIIIIKLGINDFNKNAQLGTYDCTTALPTVPTDGFSTFCESYATMLDRIMKTYPLARVYCCTLNQCERTNPTGFPEVNSNGDSLTDFNNAIRSFANAFGAGIIEHNACGMSYYNMNTYTGDWESGTLKGLHPNSAGMKLIAEKTICTLRNDFNTYGIHTV